METQQQYHQSPAYVEPALTQNQKRKVLNHIHSLAQRSVPKKDRKVCAKWIKHQIEIIFNVTDYKRLPGTRFVEVVMFLMDELDVPEEFPEDYLSS